MSPCGWCWVVAGRKVLAWPREPASSTPAAPSAARELTLPQTDLAHKADLVMLFYEEGAQVICFLMYSYKNVFLKFYYKQIENSLLL